MCATEELLGLKSLHGTTKRKDIFEEVSKCITEMGLPWDNLVGLTTDGVAVMYGQKSGLVSRIQEKLREEDTVELQLITVSYIRKCSMANPCKWNMV